MNTTLRTPAVGEFAILQNAKLRNENAQLREALSNMLVGEQCRIDVRNPCWNNRPSDIPGKHWGYGYACTVCTARAALKGTA